MGGGAFYRVEEHIEFKRRVLFISFEVALKNNPIKCSTFGRIKLIELNVVLKIFNMESI